MSVRDAIHEAIRDSFSYKPDTDMMKPETKISFLF